MIYYINLGPFLKRSVALDHAQWQAEEEMGMAFCMGCARDRDRSSGPLLSTPSMRKKAVLPRVSFSFHPYYKTAAICLLVFFFVFGSLFSFSMYYYYYYYYYYYFRCVFSQAFSSWYFSWTSGDPHLSGFKFHTAVLSVLCVMFQV